MKWKIISGSKNEDFKVEDILKILLKNRNITDSQIDNFLRPKLENVTVKNVGLDEKNIEQGIKLIKKTIDEKKAIVIYGDYDVDGVTGTAILWETIYPFYKNVHPYIPHRIDEGYGISEKGINNLTSQIENVGLIVTVDNGIVAEKAVKYAKSFGIQVLITDHHVKGKTIPAADALIHTTILCGAGVAYLFAKEIAFAFHTKENESHLELVALATIADLVPLNKYNRTLVKFGIERLRKTKRPGLLAIFEEAGIQIQEIDTYHIGHIIAPRLNASGRISHALDALRLICTTDNARAKKLAQILNQTNRQRQDLTFESADHAAIHVRKQKKLHNLIFVSDKAYEPGVIGLISSRIVEEFYRPAITVSIGEKISKGSARSVPGVNIIELIRTSSEFLVDAGGHPMAAGFTVETEKLEVFKNALLKKAEKIDENLFDRELTIDLEISFDAINLELYEEIKKLAPFGIGNPLPIFMTKNVQVMSMQYVGKEKNHLQLVLEKDGTVFKAMFFRHNKEKTINIGDLVNIVYTIELNEWRGNKKLELKIKDLSS